MKILFVTAEETPFAKVGGLADVSRSLPKALARLGHDVRVVIPYYKCIKKEKIDIKKAGRNIFSNNSEGVTTYFIENTFFFNRNNIYGTGFYDYPDNALRFGFFSKMATLIPDAVSFQTDIIHCNDWQTALIPFYVKHKKNNNKMSKIKTLFTIHNMAYQGLFNKHLLRFLGIPGSFFTPAGLEFYGKINFMKAGILYSDIINTVSRTYAREILTPEYGAGLYELLNERNDILYGIPNGVDYDDWSPEKDKFIKTNYNPGTAEKKKECKKDLIEYAGLDVAREDPIIGVIARFSHQKGMDIFAEAAEDIIKMGASIVVLGRGEVFYNRLFAGIRDKYPGKFFTCNDFNNELAHKIEAGADIFAMPSRYEPCGLNQMYSIKYGTIPVVRATGGLEDVIVDFDSDMKKGNGFKFYKPDKESLLGAIERALTIYEDKELWARLIQNAMSYDFSWEKSAHEYIKLYERLL